METYLNTEQAAAYLGIKERKLYELVAEGLVPCSKVTGKWLFPRGALDRWVELGLARPAGLVLEAHPPIVGGSHDPLLEWALRQSGSGLALLSEGSLAGFQKLEENQVGLAAVHLHGAEPGANTHYLQQSARLTDGILIAFAEREQGLLLAQGNPKGIESLSDLVKLKARLGLRQPGAGAQQLAEQMFGQAGVDFAAVSRSMPVYPTGGELAYAIRSTEVDAGIATRAAAKAQGLDFVPLIWEQFDLALRRRTYFEPGPQKLFALMRSAEFARRAEELTGYRVAEAGMVRFNR